MDISAITNIISNLGFPIACVFALAWFGWYMVKYTNEINAKNMEQGGKTSEGSSSDIVLKSTKTTTYAFAGWGTSATSGVNLTSSSSYAVATIVYA